MAAPLNKGNATRALASPDDYRSVFESTKSGQNVLADLTARFHDRDTYVPGGLEAQRETERRAAQKQVISYILQKLGQIDEGNEHAG